MGRIQGLWQKIKNWSEDAIGEWGLIAIVLLLGLASFGLGRLSALEQAKPVVSIKESVIEGEPRAMHVGGLLVASRRGSAYHYPWCPGAATIAESNKIWYSIEDAALRAGYAPAKNCKGLEAR